MNKERGLTELLFSTRIKRTLPILTGLLLPAAYANKFPPELLILSLVIVLIYSAASIHNAYKDNDYNLPKYSKTIIIILIILAILFASLNKIILITSILAIFLGYIYNTTARYIIFGDGLIAGLTHYVLPIIASSLLVGLNKEIIIQISIIVYFIAICMGPITNLKDIKEDRKRGYKTLVNTVKNPFTVAAILFEMQFLFILILYFFFSLSYINLILLLPVYILKIFITTKIYQQKSKEALNYLRLYLILSFTFLILSLTNNLYIIMQNLIILILYLITIIYSEIK